MIPAGMQVFVALEPVDMRFYAEPGVMRSSSLLGVVGARFLSESTSRGPWPAPHNRERPGTPPISGAAKETS